MLLLSMLLSVLAGAAVVGMDSQDKGAEDDVGSENENNPSVESANAEPEAGGTRIEDFAAAEGDGEDTASAEGLDESSDEAVNDAAGGDDAAPFEPEVLAAPGEEITGDDLDNELFGTEMDDTLLGGAGNDRLDAAGGNDIVAGDIGDDVVLGRGGADVVRGGAGNDMVKGGKGDDVMNGGDGNDTLIGAEGDDTLIADAGTNYLRGDDGDDLLVGVDGEDDGAPDTLEGSAGTDRLVGDNGDILTGGEGVSRFEVVVGGENPVIITDFVLSHPSGSELSSDLFSLIRPTGELLTQEDFAANGARIEDTEDGSAVLIYYDGVVAARLEGMAVDDLIQSTRWVGNFNPDLTNKLDGDDLLTGDESGATTDDTLFGAAGNDTLIGGFGADYLDGGIGDDVLNALDDTPGGGAADVAIGGAGDDELIGDAGDILAGEEGRDTYVIHLPEEAGDPPVEIYGYEYVTADGLHEFVAILGHDGEALSPEEVGENLTVYQDAGGVDAIMEYNGDVIAILHGVNADDLQELSQWIASYDPDPISEDPAPISGSDAEQISMTLQSTSGTGQTVSEEMFGANLVFSVNTEDGDPNENYRAGARAFDLLHFRFPAGQGDSEDGLDEGVDWLNVIELTENDDGEMVLRDEVITALDAAIAAHNEGADVKVTMVIATKFYTIEEYEDKYDDIARFAEIMMTDYYDQIEAIEIGNEYWAIGETNYGTKADIAARALAEGMARAGVEEEDQPSIIVQMATPNDGSEFHTSVDDRPFGERRDDANQQIIDQLSEEAREAIDGVVEHYYYRRDYDEFTGDGNEQGFIPNDYAIWEANFEKELDLHITEWNIRTTNLEQNGIRSAGILPQMMEYMVSWGADAAHTWPIVHNTTSMLAGNRYDMPILNEDGWVVNSVRGAVYDVMSEELVGLQLLETTFTNDDGRMEVYAYQSDDKVVVQVTSRTPDVVELDLDLTTLVSGFESASGVKVGYDRSSESSDGVYRDNGEYVSADSTVVDGQQYYFNEYDVRGTVTDVEVDAAEVLLNLNPYEMIQLVYEFGDTPPPDAVPGENVTGTNGADDITTGDGNDSVEGLAGNDEIITNAGFDTIYGGDGDDRIEAGKQDDVVFGDDGIDAIYGHAGDDSLKGGDGSDTISGNQGADTLIGSEGDDVLRGGEDNDTLNGGKGADTLKGGAGRDTLTGWSGSDLFEFELEDMMDGDIITDFEPGRDLISLNYSDIQSIDDLVISQIAQGILIEVGDYGGMLLQGDLTVAQIADARNFVFASA